VGFVERRGMLFLFVWALLIIPVCSGGAGAQGLQQSPYGAADMLRRGMSPYNSVGSSGSMMGLPKESDSLYLGDGMLRGILPLIPNLQFGYLYDFGNNRVRGGRFTADYLAPVGLSADAVIFGEAHAEFENFRKTLTSAPTESGFNKRLDMSFGGGYRKFLRRDTLLGVNAFYDASRLGGARYSSGSVGFEMAALLASHDALDLNFNWYGKLFNGAVIRNAFRYGPSNFDFQAGYAHELWAGGPDLRLSATGYKFDIGNSVYGWNAGAELKSRDGMFVLQYTIGHDKLDDTYQAVGAFVNVGLQVENILKGESPFTMPEPIFKSPRTLTYMLTQKVKRDWRRPATVIVATQTDGANGGCNTDRFLGSLPMTGPITEPSQAPKYEAEAMFPAVPNTCLDPTKRIVVEFDYRFRFNQPPGPVSVRWNVLVRSNDGGPAGAYNAKLIDMNFPNPDQDTNGHLSIPLDQSLPISYPYQSAFTRTGQDPSIIFIQFLSQPGADSLTVTNVVIHFNR
jgi:hypothetical protein